MTVRTKQTGLTLKDTDMVAVVYNTSQSSLEFPVDNQCAINSFHKKFAPLEFVYCNLSLSSPRGFNRLVSTINNLLCFIHTWDLLSGCDCDFFSVGWIGIAIAKLGAQPILEPNGNCDLLYNCYVSQWSGKESQSQKLVHNLLLNLMVNVIVIA